MSEANDFGSCASCGEALHGKHCHNCGEKKLSRVDLTLKKFISQAFDVITHFDSRMWKTVYLLLRKPGFLVTENLDGRRVNYAKPIQLFFVLNVIYFIVLGHIEVGFDAVTNRAEEHMSNFLYGNLVTPMVNKKIKEENISPEQYYEKFYNEIYVESRLFIILMIPLLALWFKLIYLRKDILYYEHLVFSTYYFCFVLLFYTFFLNAIIYPLLYKTSLFGNFDSVFEYESAEVAAELIVLTASAIYIYFALKQVYKESIAQTLAKTFLSLIGLILTFNLFRFLIFLAVYYST
jgi:Protein of unknown function (DUF3667)